MSRRPNHRFSIARERETTALEAGLDSIKRHIIHSFTKKLPAKTPPVSKFRSVYRQGNISTNLRGTQEQYYRMGKNSKKRAGNLDREDLASGDSHDGSIICNVNGSHGEARSRNERGNLQDDKSDSRNIEDQGIPDLQADPDFSPYIEVVEELKSQMVAGQKAMKNVQTFFTRQQREIQDVVETRQRLYEMTERCKEYKTTVKTLRREEKEKDEALAEKVADVEKEREALARAKKEVVKYKEELEHETEKFGRRVKIAEAEQKLKLDEQRRNLEKEQNEKYERRLKFLENEMKERQDNDKKRVVGLQAENNKLLQELEEQNGKLRQVNSKLKDTETLKIFYEEKADKLKQDLKSAENEFGLDARTTEF